ncbi:Hypothetical predicted protein [Podarcis lilfordi]|uniref:Uncharacterized protein n=1 Tax=Podarcis lilfordi TaxID=74358 RepID=A0AA35P8C5_9SAUR|nr:Hypothetical predicted protein [Podarcis lilfordi]
METLLETRLREITPKRMHPGRRPSLPKGVLDLELSARQTQRAVAYRAASCTEHLAEQLQSGGGKLRRTNHPIYFIRAEHASFEPAKQEITCKFRGGEDHIPKSLRD